MNCKECGAVIPVGWSNCKLCGATAPDETGAVCRRCGKRSNPGEKFCGGCGEPLTGGPRAPAEPEPPAERKKFNPLPMLIAIVASITVILGIISLSDSSFTAYGRGYDSTIEKYVDYYCDGQWDKLLELYHEDVLEMDLADPYNAEEYLAQSGEAFVSGRNEWLGYGWDYTYEITENEDLTGSDLADAKEWIREDYGLSATAVKEVEVEITMSGYLHDATYTGDLMLVKIGWDWYLIGEL